MPTYQFQTHTPVELYVEIGRGAVDIDCTDTTESVVTVTGSGADDVVVEQRGTELRVVEPHRSGFSRSSLRVEVAVPTGSHPTTKTGSADLTVRGEAGSVWSRSGSGDVFVEAARADLRTETGSGDVRVDRVGGDARVKSGSGDVLLGPVGGSVQVATGSGDVRLVEARGAASVKTGSGDLAVEASHGDVSASTGSGDIEVRRVHAGRVSAKGASGDVSLGIVAGVPVWTDVSTVSGSIRSTLQGAGQPEEGQDHIEVRAQTVSGNVVLREV